MDRETWMGIVGILILVIYTFWTFFPMIYVFVLRERSKRLDRRMRDLENRVYGNADKDVK